MNKNEQIENLASQMDSILETPFWALISSSVLEFVGMFLIIVAVIYIFMRSNAPGTKIMFVGVMLYLSTFLVLLLISFSFEEISIEYSNIIWFSELIGSFSLFISGFGLLRYSLSL